MEKTKLSSNLEAVAGSSHFELRILQSEEDIGASYLLQDGCTTVKLGTQSRIPSPKLRWKLIEFGGVYGMSLQVLARPLEALAIPMTTCKGLH